MRCLYAASMREAPPPLNRTCVHVIATSQRISAQRHNIVCGQHINVHFRHNINGGILIGFDDGCLLFVHNKSETEMRDVERIRGMVQTKSPHVCIRVALILTHTHTGNKYPSEDRRCARRDPTQNISEGFIHM